MRPSIPALVFTTLSALLPSPPRAAELAPVAEQVKAWKGPGAVATAEKRDGKWVFAMVGQPFAAPGHAEVAPERVLFEIGSISKVFTGLLLAHATKDGKLSLDDTLAQRLPVKFDHAETGAITLRQLATHTSCLPRLPDNMMHADGTDPYAQYDEKALFDFLSHAKLDGKPPCACDYSNLGFGILGVVVERAYGKPWATLVAEKITGPLGMPDTVVTLSDDQKARFADPWAGEEPAHPWTFQAIAGAGALRSTLADMSRLADAFLDGPKGALAGVWPVFAGDYAEMPSVGGRIGLAILHLKDHGDDCYLHDGGTGGYRSEVRAYPGTGRAAVVLASNAQASPEKWLANWRGSADEHAAPTETDVAARQLRDYVGVYPIDKQARFTVLRSGDGLLVRLTGQPFIPIFASGKDEFFYKAVEARITFARNAEGEVSGLTLHQNGRDIPATRSADPPPAIEFPSVATLAGLAGEYDFGAFQKGSTITVSAHGETLFVQLTGQPAMPVFCTAKDRFEYDVVQAALTFERDKKGNVVAVTLHQNGADMTAPRK